MSYMACQSAADGLESIYITGTTTARRGAVELRRRQPLPLRESARLVPWPENPAYAKTFETSGGIARHFRAKNRALNGISGQNVVLNGISGQNRVFNGISGQKRVLNGISMTSSCI
jgi:hypothetical protein